ncbi:phosphatase PAP2 family protein [Leifsonia sp. A12D58]|uniref:phosphatase PAP2 family protein n=1 Tax=Leifsonia sp. A12D58 TaxID=3397674 RepID=UPI0039E0CED6
MNHSEQQPTDAASPNAKRISHRWPLISGIGALVLAGLLGALLIVRANGEPTVLDVEWMSEIIEHRSPWWTVPSLAMNYIGGGIIGIFVVPIVIIVALLLVKRPTAALYYLAATLLSSAVVQILKNVFGRARPEDILVTSDFGSFPSGHVANAATMAVTLGIIFPRVWVWVAGAIYTVVMMLSRTYLGAHWLTDTIGGLLVGIGVAIVVWVPLAARLDGERNLRQRPNADGGATPARSAH